MRVELLHIADCPSWEAAARLLRLALDSVGQPETPIITRLIDSPEAAERAPFAGSPTILVEGADLFPSDSCSRGLACRVYLTPQGVARFPTREQIEEALTAHV